jgi:hypothetical protein
MPGQAEAICGLMAVDVVGFSHRDRTESIQVRIRAALYGMLEHALGTSGIPWEEWLVPGSGCLASAWSAAWVGWSSYRWPPDRAKTPGPELIRSLGDLCLGWYRGARHLPDVTGM